MNINQLKYFVSVAVHQSFTKAATQFFISQTAITQQIHALEESIGIKLIDHLIVSEDDFMSLSQTRDTADIFRSDASGVGLAKVADKSRK